MRRIGGFAVDRRRFGCIGGSAVDPRAGRFVGADIREHHETVPGVGLGQAGARTGCRHGWRINDCFVHSAVDINPDAITERPVVTMVTCPPAGMTRVDGKWAERGEPPAVPREVAAAEVAAPEPTAAESLGVGRAGAKAGSGNRSRSCETKDDFA